MRSLEPRSSSSCAACKFLKRRCTSNCQFAPYFRSDEPAKFAKVHKVFGASNVSKILNEVPEEQREDTVNSLVYEAEVRLRDPVYGCIGAIASLQKKMVELQHDLILARARLACCVPPVTTVTTAPRPALITTNSVLSDDQTSSLIDFSTYNNHEIPSCIGLEEVFYQNSSRTGQNEWMNELGQFPFQ
ncbi:OLC1v1026856C1 [Oldenlandia corymbosa var. corymbosa]|uniref:OLC1v1026856C1 n=1 Tax=Oldenlandia corymbosa var. corymbosa TaxID=529605 RepID=A0AAV1C820_OLDCO|nr:OLC1v1026856C1 [Oldenlandia corymbosa var. corymbosa]